MAYLVMIERIGGDGVPTGQPTIRSLPSEKEAMDVLRGTALGACTARQQMLVSLYDHDKQLLVSYTCRDGGLAPLDARAP